MEFLNSLGYKWVHYGAELFGNHVRRIDIAGTKIGIGRDDWPPQGNHNTADKLEPCVWLINSVTEYADEPDDTYYCYFFTTIDHERRSIFYRWIKGDIRPYNWTLQGQDKNAAIIFNDCKPSDRAYFGYIEGDKHVIPVEPLLCQAKLVHNP